MCEVIVVTSGKGGVGKTTTSANIGTADVDGNEEFDEEVLHMRQLLKTKLVDMDLSLIHI